MDPTPLLRKLDAVTVRVPDLDAGLRFYAGALGHRLKWRNDEIGQAGLALPESDTELVLATDLPYEPNWLVDSADAAAERIRAAGGRVVHAPFDIAVGRAVVVADPFDNHLVLIDPSKGRYVVDESGAVTGLADADSRQPPRGLLGGRAQDAREPGPGLAAGAAQGVHAGGVEQRRDVLVGDGVDASATLSLHADQPVVAEHAQLVGHARLLHPGGVDELGHAVRRGEQTAQQADARRRREREHGIGDLLRLAFGNLIVRQHRVDGIVPL